MNIHFQFNHDPTSFMRHVLLAGTLLVLLTSSLQGQVANSTKKIRVKPNSASQKIGSAVNWQPDFNTAVAQSKQTGKPLFWYVPTLPDTFMDRKAVIDRYMLAGPFSWPAIIEALNENAICLKTPPTKQQQRKFELQRYKFVEPGFVIFDPKGNKLSQVDKLTTLHPVWLNHLIQKTIGVAEPSDLYSGITVPIWMMVADQKFEDALTQIKQALNKPDLSNAQKAELELLAGMSVFRSGQHAEAIQIWKATGERYPGQPLAWKAAAEAQLIGPFSRGFETHRTLPAAVLTAGVDSRGSAAPKNVYTRPQLEARSVQFLLAMQNRDGSFRDSDYDYGGTDSLGNVHVAVTSLAGIALLKQYENLASDSLGQKKRLFTAVTSAAKFVANDANLNKHDRDEILWACAFRLRFLVACQLSADAQIRNAVPSGEIPRIVKSLETIQTKRGSWYHEYKNPFTTATALLALQDADQARYPVDADRIEKGSANLASQRYRNGAFPYLTSDDNQAKRANRSTLLGSVGRMPLCELALLKTGKSNDQNLTAAIEASIKHHELLAKSYKYDNHTDTLSYGGFFFWYDMRSRCEAIKHVADKTQRAKFVEQQYALIMGLPEVDGCFVDSHELGRVYSTSMALICFELLD